MRPKYNSAGKLAYGKRKTGCCKICKRRGYTEIHHIISQTRRPDFKFNKRNMIELCQYCHNETTASLVHNYLTSSRRSRTATTACFRCGSSRHWYRNCKKASTRRKKRKTKSTTSKHRRKYVKRT